MYGYSETKMEMEYKGTVFECTIEGYGNNTVTVHNLKSYAEEVYFPEKYEKFPVAKIAFSEYGEPKYQKKYPGIKRIYISASINYIDVNNFTFPDLEVLTIDHGNTNYSTDGVLLLEKNGTVVSGCLVNGTGILQVPASVKRATVNSLAWLDYREIQFENPVVSFAADVFEGTPCMQPNEKDGLTVIGDLVYAINSNLEEVVIPEHVKRFQKGILAKAHLKKITSPILPPLVDLNYYGPCYDLVITKPLTSINPSALTRFACLQSLSITEKDKKYKTIDGVLFSKNGKILYSYPRSKKDTRYSIPEGVEAIYSHAFSEQENLEELIMPDSVKNLGLACFYLCSELKHIKFSANLEGIPDSSDFCGNLGTFEKCRKLHVLNVPDNILYIGARAFYDCPLEKVTLGNNVAMIGEYAFATSGYPDTTLKEISLPRSLKHIGKGALAGIKTVTAHEGTAKGLVGAINAFSYETSRVWWTASRIKMQKNDGSEDSLYIPENITNVGKTHLVLAWDNGDKFAYQEYERCFEQVKNSEERMEMAREGLERMQQNKANNEGNVYETYVRNIAGRFAKKLLEDGDEDKFIEFLRQGYLSSEAMGKLLKQAHKLNLTLVSAYIMEEQNKITKRKSGFSL